MNQEQSLARRDELARENQLGKLELYRTPLTFRERVILRAVFGGFALLVLIVLGANGHLLFGILLGLVISFYLFPLVQSPIDRNDVYIYTNGLVCFNSSGGEQIVHWGEIREVGSVGGGRSRSGYDYVKLNDGTSIRLPEFGSLGSANFGVLKRFIEEKIHRRENGPTGAPPYGQPQSPSR